MVAEIHSSHNRSTSRTQPGVGGEGIQAKVELHLLPLRFLHCRSYVHDPGVIVLNGTVPTEDDKARPR